MLLSTTSVLHLQIRDVIIREVMSKHYVREPYTTQVDATNASEDLLVSHVWSRKSPKEKGV